MTKAENYFYNNITKMDKRFLNVTKKKLHGEDCIDISPKYEGLSIQGYWCSEAFAKELLDIRCKKDECRTPYERDLLNTAYNFFYSHMDACEDFVDWDNYVRFITALDDDFFGID